MNYWGFRLASAVLGMLPEVAARHLGELAGKIAWHRADLRKRNAIRAMARVRAEAPDDPSAQAIAGAQAMFVSYGRYWAEAFWIRPRRADAILDRIEVEGIEHFRAALSAGRGVVLALAHVGNWEVAGTVARSEGAELLAVAERLPDPRIVQWFVGLRNALGIDIALADGGVLEVCRQALERNAAVALLSDRNLSGRGIRMPFFGEETRLPIGPARLALDTGATILPVGSYFQSGAGHRVVISAPVLIEANDDVETLTHKVGRALEVVIQRAPEQWHMVQPNWPSDRRAATELPTT